LINVEVSHAKFGSGIITACSDSIITVHFPGDAGEKRFQYPSAFLSYLTFKDPVRQDAVTAELAERKRIAAEAEKLEMELRAAAQVKVPAVKRKTTPKTPAKPRTAKARSTANS